jgi:hypothetical protein
MRFNRFSTWKTRLRFAGDSDGQVAWFGSTQLTSRRHMTAENLSVRVYGAPVKGAVVAVSGPEGMLIGRIVRSSLQR